MMKKLVMIKKSLIGYPQWVKGRKEKGFLLGLRCFFSLTAVFAATGLHTFAGLSFGLCIATFVCLLCCLVTQTKPHPEGFQKAKSKEQIKQNFKHRNIKRKSKGRDIPKSIVIHDPIFQQGVLQEINTNEKILDKRLEIDIAFIPQDDDYESVVNNKQPSTRQEFAMQFKKSKTLSSSFRYLFDKYMFSNN